MNAAHIKSADTPREGSRGVGVVLAVLGSLALFSFVMAGLVGEHEKSAQAAAASGAAFIAHAATHHTG